MTEQQKFECWAIVEVMGHSKYAGFVSEQAMGGASFVRVDVPECVYEEERPGKDADGYVDYGAPRVKSTVTVPAFTKLLGQSSIFAITPTTEHLARAAASGFRARPISEYDLPEVKSVPILAETLDSQEQYDEDKSDE